MPYGDKGIAGFGTAHRRDACMVCAALIAPSKHSPVSLNVSRSAPFALISDTAERVPSRNEVSGLRAVPLSDGFSLVAEADVFMRPNSRMMSPILKQHGSAEVVGTAECQAIAQKNRPRFHRSEHSAGPAEMPLVTGRIRRSSRSAMAHGLAAGAGAAFSCAEAPAAAASAPEAFSPFDSALGDAGGSTGAGAASSPAGAEG